MAWFHLLVAAAFEVAFAMGMKFSPTASAGSGRRC